MKFSVCVPYRPDGGRRDTIWSWVEARWRHQFPDAEIVVGEHAHGPFNLSLARNRAVAQAKNDIVVIADSDVFCEKPAIMAGLRAVNLNPNAWLFPYDHYYCSTGKYADALLASDPTLLVREKDIEFWDHSTNTQSGCVIMNRETYIEAGGYDTEFKDWGPEDTAFALAMDEIVSPHNRVNGYALHIWHSRERADEWPSRPESVQAHERFKLYQQAETADDFRRIKGTFKC